MAEESKQEISVYKPLTNPGMIEMERVCLQLYAHRQVTKQDILDLARNLKDIAKDFPDKFSHHN